MALRWQLSDYLFSASMVRCVCWVMSARHLLFGWRREQFGCGVSLCWCEKGSLITILGRVWANHLLSRAYSGLHLEIMHTHTHTNANTHANTSMCCPYFFIHVKGILKAKLLCL